MVLAGAVVAGGAGGEIVCGAGGAGFAGAATSRSTSRLRRQSRLMHEAERQCPEDSMCTRWPPTLNEIERPAWADELSAISTARNQNRFIRTSPQVMQKTSRGGPRLNVI